MPPDSSQPDAINVFGSSQAAILPVDSSNFAGMPYVFGGLIIVSLAALFGGMQYVILASAVGLAALVVKKPQEAVTAGWLFMAAAMTLLPVPARLHYLDGSTIGDDGQQYYWAVGSLIVVVAGLYSVGWSRIFRAPAALKAFAVVAIASAIFGYSRGNPAPYIMGQLYGALLFVAYFIIGSADGDEGLIFQRLKFYGVLIGLAFIVYYATVFSQFGFHKEDSTVTSQIGYFSIVVFAIGVFEKRPWFAAWTVLFAVSMLLFMRHTLLTFLFAAALVLGMRATSRLRRLLCFAAAGLILLPSMFPFGAQYILDLVEENAPHLYANLPEGTQDSVSLVYRNLQLASGAATLVTSPLFGQGMGSEFSWQDDKNNTIDEYFIDNGWAYLIVKMGLAGLLTFGWLSISLLRCMSRKSLALSTTMLAILMIGMFSEPVCFQFTTAPIAGALAGLLYASRPPKGKPGSGLGAASG